MINPNTTFRTGEKVYLNSGSPELTIIAISNADKMTTVEWHNGSAVEQCSLPSVCFRSVGV
jgi:uncharacterized protein YodC (DUF2158 family)